MIGLLAMGSVLALAAATAPRAGRHPLVPVSWWARLERDIARRLAGADLPLGVSHPVGAWMVLVALGAVASLAVAGWWGLGAGVLAAIAGPVVVVVVRGDRSDQQLARQLPVFIDSLSRQLRVGRSVPQAFAELRHEFRHPLDLDLTRITRHLAQGRALDTELEQWGWSRPSVDLRVLTTALSLGQRSGGERAAALDAVARSLRDKQAVAGELAALTAQARASAAVVALAPIGFAGVLWALGVAPLPRTDQPVVLGAVLVGLVFDAMGLAWMRRIARPRW